MKKRYRIVKPVRFFTFILITVLLLTFTSISLLNRSNADAASVNTYRQVLIEDNDSIWSIAENYCSNDMDIRDYVREVCEINDIALGDVQSGDLVFFPVYS